VSAGDFSGSTHDFDLAVGSVLGLRWWALRRINSNVLLVNAPSCPLGSERLCGVQSFWQPGVNEAQCMPWNVSGVAIVDPVPGHDVPFENCGCGFWAYWNTSSAPRPPDIISRCRRQVIGVVEGFGRTLLGDRGFRCQRARIVALAATGELGGHWLRDYPGQRQNLAKSYGVPIYLSLTELLERHPTTPDYLPEPLVTSTLGNDVDP